MVIVDGRGSLVTDDGSIELRAGSVVFTPRRVPHVHVAADDDDVEYVYFTATGHDTVVDDHEFVD
jgi:quercetin dioxygenase-like cupin family protein